ncbi:MAG: molybdate ABC transporter substrate-binding protein [Terriglobia bacterium]
MRMISLRHRRTGPLAALSAVLAAVLALGSCTGSRKNQESARLTVSAAVSLKESLQEIAGLYQRQQPQVSIIYNFAGSGTLQRQIEQGAPVDVFASASPREMDALQAKGLVMVETRRNIAANEVVLIAPQDSGAVSGFGDLTAPRVKRIALGEPASVPAGKYAQQTLVSLNLWDQIQAKLVFAQDVRQVLEFVSTGNADAGMVYRTDTQITDRVKVVAAAPDSSHSPVVYPAAVLRASHHPDQAKQFVEFLAGPEAQAALARHGFVRIADSVSKLETGNSKIVKIQPFSR